MLVVGDCQEVGESVFGVTKQIRYFYVMEEIRWGALVYPKAFQMGLS